MSDDEVLILPMEEQDERWGEKGEVESDGRVKAAAGWERR